MTDLQAYALLAVIVVVGTVFWGFDKMIDEARHGGGCMAVLLALLATVAVIVGGVWALDTAAGFILR